MADGGVLAPYARILRSSTYRPLWLGQLVSNFGDTLHYIALVVLLFRLTGSGAVLAGLTLAQIVAGLLLGPVAGVPADRLDRRMPAGACTCQPRACRGCCSPSAPGR